MKKQGHLTAALAFAAALTGASAASASVLVYDFQTPSLPSGAYYYAPGFVNYSSDQLTAAVVSGVTFGGLSGVQTNGSAWGFPNPPSGAQTAFIQSYNGSPTSPGSLSFDLTSLAAGSYSLNFLDALRPGFTAETFTVSYDSNILGTYTPTAGWNPNSASFDIVTGGGPLLFSGANQTGFAGDSDVGIALVTITSAPAPTPGYGLMGLAALLLGGAAMKKRQGMLGRG